MNPRRLAAIDPPRFMTADDVAHELRVSRSRAYEIMHEIPHLVCGRSLRVTRVAFDAYVRRLEVEGWQSSIAAERSTGARSGMRRSGGTASQRAAQTAAPPNRPQLDSKGKPLIRDTQPRVRRRCSEPSNDSCSIDKPAAEPPER